MRIEVPMPQMGESIAEGTVSTWLKKVGDRVERDEPIMEISTDKVDAEIPSPAAGVLVEILVHEGTTVEVGSVVAFVDTEAEPGTTTTSAPSAPSGTSTATSAPGRVGVAAERETAAAAASDVPSPSGRKQLGGNGPAAAAREAGPSTSPGSADNRPVGSEEHGEETADERLRRRSTPLVRRIAAEHGVEIGDIPGTGRAGRVTKADVLRFIESGGEIARPRAPHDGDGSFWEEFYTHVRHPEVPVGPTDRVEPLGRMTSLIAEHMVLSRRISAHVHSYFEIDYSRIDGVRSRNRGLWEQQGVKVTYTAFIASAVAQALREHPRVNASISGDRIVYRGEVNLGVAVALDWGLIVPVVKKADELSLVGLAKAIGDLANRARTKRLSPEEVQGGTFTITNPGIFGTVLGFPIVNQPQVAIMGVGAVEKRPVVISDEFGNDAIVARKRGFLSLGYDHRLVNGADADRFLARVKEILEGFPDSP
jgi:pyruvate dehydrogenase E2 component (dihydrolipoamide acetyltransferase)